MSELIGFKTSTLDKEAPKKESEAPFNEMHKAVNQAVKNWMLYGPESLDYDPHEGQNRLLIETLTRIKIRLNGLNKMSVG